MAFAMEIVGVIVVGLVVVYECVCRTEGGENRLGNTDISSCFIGHDRIAILEVRMARSVAVVKSAYICSVGMYCTIHYYNGLRQALTLRPPHLALSSTPRWPHLPSFEADSCAFHQSSGGTPILLP